MFVGYSWPHDAIKVANNGVFLGTLLPRKGNV